MNEEEKLAYREKYEAQVIASQDKKRKKKPKQVRTDADYPPKVKGYVGKPKGVKNILWLVDARDARSTRFN
jgi:hypothetical protein